MLWGWSEGVGVPCGGGLRGKIGTTVSIINKKQFSKILHEKMIYDLLCFPQILVIILKLQVIKLWKRQNQDWKHRFFTFSSIGLVSTGHCLDCPGFWRGQVGLECSQRMGWSVLAVIGLFLQHTVQIITLPTCAVSVQI